MGEPAESIFDSIALLGVTRSLVKRLPGFDKSRHTIPKWGGDRAQQFVGMIAEPELKDWGETLFADLRHSLDYKRKDLKLTIGNGEAVLESKDFLLKRSCRLDEEELSECAFETVLSDVCSSDFLSYPNFNDALGPLFDRLQCLYRKNQSVEAVIDAVEESEDGGLHVEYPSSCESCEISMAGIDAVFRCDASSVTIKLPRFSSPVELMNTVNEFAEHFRGDEELLRRLPISFGSV